MHPRILDHAAKMFSDTITAEIAGGRNVDEMIPLWRTWAVRMCNQYELQGEQLREFADRLARIIEAQQARSIPITGSIPITSPVAVEEVTEIQITA